MGSIPGQEGPLEKEMETHSSTLAWEIPWTEDPVQATVHGVRKESDTTQQKNSNNKTRVHEKTHQMIHWVGNKLLSFMKQDWQGNISNATKDAQLTFVLCSKYDPRETIQTAPRHFDLPNNGHFEV